MILIPESILVDWLKKKPGSIGKLKEYIRQEMEKQNEKEKK